MNTPTPLTDTEITLTGAYTCTHHNDQMRAACPVCLVAALTTERDHWQKIAVSASHEREHNANVAQAMTAERDQLRAHVSKAILTNGGTMLCSPQVAVKYNEAIARAERAEAELVAERAEAEVERLRSDRDCEKRLRKDSEELREDAIERATKAEADLAALEQCHDDNCRGVVKIADDLATERARLDWVFHNCKVTSDDFTVHDREDLGVAMKEDAK
jgi:hypothetical protein